VHDCAKTVQSISVIFSPFCSATLPERPASQRFFIHSCIYLRIFIISYLATFLGTNSTNSLSVLMCRKAVNQSIPYITPIHHTSDMRHVGLNTQCGQPRSAESVAVICLSSHSSFMTTAATTGLSPIRPMAAGKQTFAL